MKKVLYLAILISLFSTAAFTAEKCIVVKDGAPGAVIITAEKPAKSVELGAYQLQEYIKKISGADLKISTMKDNSMPVQIYVGRSSYTDKMGVTDKGLNFGAYRLVVRKNEIILLGFDRDYMPAEPYLSRIGPHEYFRMTPEFLKKWDKLTQSEWSFPYPTNRRNYNSELGIWAQNENGSLNAVFALLRKLGVRWYFPGSFGEILPREKTVAVEIFEKTVIPDFKVRSPYMMANRYTHASREELLWQLRLGFNCPVDIYGQDWSGSLAHGIKFVSTGRRKKEIIKKHPDWFALYGKKRDSHKHCLSSEGLFKEVVKYVRFMFDTYEKGMVSVMPADGYVNICQCKLCEGKATPERGRRGQLSDHVWDFVNRIAGEVYKTHPDRKVSCFAYGAYLLPPKKITQLSPNIIVGICQTRCTFIDPAQKERYVDSYRKVWLTKLPAGHKNQLFVWEYYLHASHGTGYPVFFPHIIAEDLKDLKGKSIGEFIEVARTTDKRNIGLAFQHLNIYVNSRFYWDADQDIEKLLEEYYTLYYGPARTEMKEFIEFAEQNHPKFKSDANVLGKALEIFAKAEKKVTTDSIYGRRIALLKDFMKPLYPLLTQLKNNSGLIRENNPEAWGRHYDNLKVNLNGKADEKCWEKLYHLVDVVTGEKVKDGNTASVSAAWDNKAGTLYMLITCRDPDMKNLNIASIKNGDTGIFLGDLLEVHLETQDHAYYQLVINPAGELVDIDRKGGINWDWSSGVEAAAFVDGEIWRVELRIPVLDVTERDLDPDRSGIAGKRPSRQTPWYINVCRQKVRGDKTYMYALSPTGKKKFHSRASLGRFYIGGKRPGIYKSLARKKRETDRLEKAGKK
ncbi:MAG: DUF4838 domain-containing protein [Planctomycetota bacterium]